MLDHNGNKTITDSSNVDHNGNKTITESNNVDHNGIKSAVTLVMWLRSLPRNRAGRSYPRPYGIHLPRGF